MLRVVVESAKGIPKKKLGNPDPIAAVVFKGELLFCCLLLWHVAYIFLFGFNALIVGYSWEVQNIWIKDVLQM